MIAAAANGAPRGAGGGPDGMNVIETPGLGRGTGDVGAAGLHVAISRRVAALAGPNGAGQKPTLSIWAGGHDHPKQGRVTVLGAGPPGRPRGR